jgi:hypothetical protein
MLSNSGIHSRQLAFIGAVAASTHIGGCRRLETSGTASGGAVAARSNNSAAFSLTGHVTLDRVRGVPPKPKVS